MPILTHEMMISDEQVRRAVDYLRNSDEYPVPVRADADPAALALVDRVVEALREIPDVREDRIAHARVLVDQALPSSEELASKLIGRVVSDSIR
ncbi:MAG: hypothetical protein Q7W51_06140 [Coriobacteriia bacterium]|nr:hypothetical protein [Coriobacteriia bacterium]